MSYIQKNLASDEQILCRAFVSNAYVYGRPLVALIFGILLGIGFGFIYGNALACFLAGALAILFFVTVPLLLSGLVTRATTEIALTNQRVILKRGLFGRQTMETYLDKIESLTADQNIAGRLLGYGNIVIKGTGGDANPYNGIQNPQAFRIAVNGQIQKIKLPISVK